MPEEPIHGALTYRLAIMAGFNYDDAGHLALATAGVDHHRYMMPCMDPERLKGEIGDGVFRSGGGNPDPRGYDRYNPGPSPETPMYVREMTNQTPETPGLVQTAYYHFRDPEVAVSQVERLLVQGSGAASVDKQRRRRHLNDLGVALHLLEDVGPPWAPGAHFGSPAGRFPVGNIYIGHPERDSVDVAGRPVHLYPIVGKFPFNTKTLRSAGDIPYNAPALFRKELPEIYRFLVSARTAWYGGKDAAAPQRGPTDEQLRTVEASTRAIPVPVAVTQEIEAAIALRTKDDARSYIRRRDIRVTPAQARELGAAPDKYVPGYMSWEYRRLPPGARTEVNHQVDDLFRKKTGITRKLDASAPADRPHVREWLRIRDDVLTERLRYEVEPGSNDYVPIEVPSYWDWVDLNNQAGSEVLGRYQGVQWKWSAGDVDVEGYE